MPGFNKATANGLLYNGHCGLPGAWPNFRYRAEKISLLPIERLVNYDLPGGIARTTISMDLSSPVNFSLLFHFAAHGRHGINYR